MSMKLRTKILVITGVMLLGLFGTVYVTAAGFVLHSFDRLENQFTSRDVVRALDALGDKLSSLQSQVTDYASWDATYDYMVAPDDGYIASSLNDETLSNIKLNLVMLVQPSGQVAFAKQYDLDTDASLPIPSDLAARLQKGAPLQQRLDRVDSTTGILMLDSGPMLFASHAILTSAGLGPRRGTLIMGRYLDATEVERLARVTHLSIGLYGLARLPAGADADAAQALRGQPGYAAGRAGAEAAAVIVQPLDADTVAGYTLLQDAEGTPVLLLRVNVARAIYREGWSTVQYFLVILGGVGLVYAVMVLLFLERAVLARLARLSAVAAHIGSARDSTARLPDEGHDELGQLAAAANSMLTALHESEGKYRHLAEQSFDGIVLVDGDGTILEWNASQERITGISRTAALGRPIWEIQGRISPPERQAAMDAVWRAGRALEWALAPGPIRVAKHRIRRPDGEYRVMEVATSPIDTETGTIVGSITRDITEREYAEQLLRESEERFRNLFENAVEGIFQSNPAGRFINVNPAMARMYGYASAQEMIEQVTDISRQIHTSTESRSRFIALLQADGMVEGFEAVNLRKDGSFLWTSTHARIVRGPDGAVLCFEGSVVDITARKQAEENLRHLSAHDVLTGLYNRNHFEEILAALEQGSSGSICLAIVDVDEMKRVNDTLGHAAGDELLRRTSAVLQAAFGDALVVARIGGDEFAILMSAPAHDTAPGGPGAGHAAERLKAELQRHNAAYGAAHGAPRLSLSIGVSIAAPGERLEHTMQRADRLMYEDKRAHRCA
jgi:diguanylate cyclase (GGDEF)-like protein/PAS domain S-box-containing protein